MSQSPEIEEYLAELSEQCSQASEALRTLMQIQEFVKSDGYQTLIENFVDPEIQRLGKCLLKASPNGTIAIHQELHALFYIKSMGSEVIPSKATEARLHAESLNNQRLEAMRACERGTASEEEDEAYYNSLNEML